MRFKTYNEALDYLYTLRTFGTKLGLDNIRFLLDELGKPDEDCNYLHIAGSNGKGSTAAFLSSILQKAGLKVGLFTSPHLVRFTERIQINDVEIPEKEIVKLLNLSLNISEKMGDDGIHRHPTFFEIVTAMASQYFADQKCDVVVWETGMGGRLDATNAVTPVASIITNISLDHIQWLGDNILKIASEKAGIIKTQIPFFTAEKNADVLDLFEKKTTENNTKMIKISDFGFNSSVGNFGHYFLSSKKLGFSNAKLGLSGQVQIDNAALAAIAGYWYLANFAQISDNLSDILVSGLESAKWPARFQKLFEKPLTYIDCAHNQEGIFNLTKNLKEISPEPWTVILGVVEDKNILEIISNISSISNEIWYIKPTAKRGLSFENFSDCLKSFNKNISIKLFNSTNDILKSINKNNDKQFVICGSCYLAGDILSELQGTNRDLRSDDPLTKHQS